ncbi:MAG: HD domain-containing protein [Desulfobacterota bacterium]|nr:HD domain-containing protein [Thermodesulfobacteriota bacterium]
MENDRLDRQIRFLLEIDRLKQIIRRSYIIGASRKENAAEHSWHLAVMALVLAEHAQQPLDVMRVVRMLLIHDLVEIDAGDTFIYDTVGNRDKADRERIAAARIFGLLPDDQQEAFRELWEEFEQQASPEARFAAALDRLMPLLHNYHSKGRTWQEHNIKKQRVIDRNRSIQDGSAQLWEVARRLIDDAVAQGYLSE